MLNRRSLNLPSGPSPSARRTHGPTPRAGEGRRKQKPCFFGARLPSFSPSRVGESLKRRPFPAGKRTPNSSHPADAQSAESERSLTSLSPANWHLSVILVLRRGADEIRRFAPPRHGMADFIRPTPAARFTKSVKPPQGRGISFFSPLESRACKNRMVNGRALKSRSFRQAPGSSSCSRQIQGFAVVRSASLKSRLFLKCAERGEEAYTDD